MADGIGCKCCAYNESECGCGIDWTPQEIYDLRARIAELEGVYGALAVEHEYLKDKLTAPPSEGEIANVQSAVNTVLNYTPERVVKLVIETFMEGRR